MALIANLHYHTQGTMTVSSRPNQGKFQFEGISFSPDASTWINIHVLRVVHKGQDMTIRMYHRYRPEIHEPTPSLSRHGAKIGGYLGFFHDQYIDLWFVRCVVWAWRLARVKCHMVHEDCGRILFAFVSACVVRKKQNTPNWSSMATCICCGMYRSTDSSFSSEESSSTSNLQLKMHPQCQMFCTPLNKIIFVLSWQKWANSQKSKYWDFDQVIKLCQIPLQL